MICVMNCICPQLKSHLMGMDYKAKFQMNNGGGLVTGSFQTIVSYASHWLRAIFIVYFLLQTLCFFRDRFLVFIVS